MKAIFGLTVIPAAIVGGCLAACISKRVRDLFFLILVFCAPMIERVDVNFVSREWYRGTSRGFEVSILDIISVSLLVSAILVPRRGESRAYWPGSLGWMLLFFFYAVFNVAICQPKLFALFELFKMGRGLVLFLAVAFYLRSERELRLLILSLAVCVAYQGLLAVKQRYIDGVHRVFGTIDDSNSLSVFFCMTGSIFVAAINSRLPRTLKILCSVALAIACVGEVLTISRAGVVILAITLLGAGLTTTSFHLTPRKIIVTLIVCLGVGGIAAKSWKTLHARFEESNLEQEYGKKHNLGRGYYIRIANAIAEDRLFGVGLNNWSYWVSNRYGPKLGYRFVPYAGTDVEPSDVIPSGSNVDEAQAAPAHNLGALTAGELGIPGLILFALVWLRWFHMGASFLWRRTPDPMRRLGVGIFFGICGVFLQNLTEWVYRQTPLYYMFHILIGALATLHYMKKAARKAKSSREAACLEPVLPQASPVPTW